MDGRAGRRSPTGKLRETRRKFSQTTTIKARIRQILKIKARDGQGCRGESDVVCNADTHQSDVTDLTVMIYFIIITVKTAARQICVYASA